MKYFVILAALILFPLMNSYREEFDETRLDADPIQHAKIPEEYLPEPIRNTVGDLIAQADLLQKKDSALFSSSSSHSSSPTPRKKMYNWLPKRFTVSHVQGNENKIAYGTNFTTVGLLFSPPYRMERFLPMVDLRGHRFDDNTYAANIGVIGRYVPASDTFCYVLGLNAYYDYRQGGIGYFQQIGIGAEILGERWDFRGNAYVPFGSKKNVKVCMFDDYIGDFVITSSFLEEVSYSFNAEVGYLAINSKDFLFYAAAGPYYISGREGHNTTLGGKVRIRPQYQDYFAVDLSVSYDSLFKTIFQAEFIIYLPLYQIGNQNKKPCGITDRQIYQPVERFEVMPLMRQSCWKTNF